MKIVRSILLNILTGASAAIALLMVAVAYSDRLHPDDYPSLACAGLLFPFFLAANLIMLMLWIMVSWRRSWIPLLAFVVAYPSIRIYLPLHMDTEPPAESIKIISYNVACYQFDKREMNPKDSIFSYLRHQDADIVCLQEDIIRKGDVADFSDIYPYNDTVHISSPSLVLINAIGIHTRFPILRKERIDYPSLANGSVAYFLQIGSDTVIVINNHLETTHLSGNDRQRYQDMISGDMNRQDAKEETRLLISKLSQAMAERAVQAEAVHRYIQAHSNYPLIVCGDFNDSPISYVRRTIADGLTDCYAESGRGPGISYKQKGFFVRIDHILCSNHFFPSRCYVDNNVRGSDHYPVLCWLSRKQM